MEVNLSFEYKLYTNLIFTNLTLDTKTLSNVCVVQMDRKQCAQDTTIKTNIYTNFRTLSTASGAFYKQKQEQLLNVNVIILIITIIKEKHTYYKWEWWIVFICFSCFDRFPLLCLYIGSYPSVPLKHLFIIIKMFYSYRVHRTAKLKYKIEHKDAWACEILHIR